MRASQWFNLDSSIPATAIPLHPLFAFATRGATAASWTRSPLCTLCFAPRFGRGIGHWTLNSPPVFSWTLSCLLSWLNHNLPSLTRTAHHSLLTLVKTALAHSLPHRTYRAHPASRSHLPAASVSNLVPHPVLQSSPRSPLRHRLRLLRICQISVVHVHSSHLEPNSI